MSVKLEKRQISYYPRKLTVWKSQNIIFVKEYFYMFFLAMKYINKHKVKQILELAKTWLFVKGAFQRNVFCSVLISMPA